jgi:uncharacterized protein YjiS (DUF1127 family)
MPHTSAKSLSFQPRRGLVARLMRSVIAAFSRSYERRLLSRLDPHLLRDIGLSPEEAQTECAKPFWRS